MIVPMKELTVVAPRSDQAATLQRLLDAGFTFTHTSLLSALEAALPDERAA